MTNLPKRIDYLQYVPVGIILGVIMVNVPGVQGFKDDINCWINWSDTIRQHGLRNVYDGGTNYLPVYHYVLWAFSKFAPDRDFLVQFSYILRYFTLIVEMLGLWILYLWSGKRISFACILTISLLNPAFIYNNLIWGQVDGMLATLAIASLYFVYNRNYISGALLLCVMLNFKLQGIIFIPLYFLILLAQTSLRQWPKVILTSFLTLTATQVVILLPFMSKPGGVQQILHTLNSLIGYVPKVSSLAFNFWSLSLGAAADTTPDHLPVFAGISYQQTGLYLFLSASFLTLFPLIRFVYLKQIMKRTTGELPKETVWSSAALLTLSFFYFNTQMHERYCHPALIFIAALFFNDRKYWLIYLLFSFAYLMNLEFVLRWLELNNYDHSWLFDRTLIASLFGGTIILLWIALFKQSCFAGTGKSLINTKQSQVRMRS